MQRREVRGLADDRLLLRRAFADQAADHRQPGGDPDPRLERDGFDIEAANSVDAGEASPHRPFGVVLMAAERSELLAQELGKAVAGNHPPSSPDGLGSRRIAQAMLLPRVVL